MDDLVAVLRDRVATLEERVRQLEDVLTPPWAPPVEWRLTSAEARVFAHLMTRDMATKESIMAALYSDRADDHVEPKIVDVFVCKMRKKLRPYQIQIETVFGQGYALVDRPQFQHKAAA